MQGPALPWSTISSAGSMVLLTGCLAVVLGCHSSAGSSSRSQKAALPVSKAGVITVEHRRWPTIVRSQGSLVADEEALVGAKVAGRVATVHVDLGDFTREGELLVTLDQVEFRLEVEQAVAQLAQARSALGLVSEQTTDELEPQESPVVRQERALWEEAKAHLERAEQLQTERAITPAAYDQIAAAERVAEARCAAALNSVHERIALIGVREVELALAQERLRDAVIRAPFDGLIQQRLTAPGVYVRVGNPIATIIRTDPLRYRGTLPERHAQSLGVGQEVRLEIESVAEPRMVAVTRISPALDLRSRSLLFEVEVANHGHELRSGLFAEAEVVVNPQAEALVVPRSAVSEFAGSMKVWKVVEGVAREQEVLVGERRPAGVEILSGLTAGDMILSDSSQGRVTRIEPSAARPENAAAGPSGDLTAHQTEESDLPSTNSE